jgi:hypothetical protein
MNLYKRHYVGNKWREPSERIEVTVPQKQERAWNKVSSINSERVSEITEEVMCWRKANAIHKWFVDNVQHGEDDCREHDVSRSQLVILMELCKKVLDSCELVDAQIVNGYRFTPDGMKVAIMVDGKKIKDASVANELLPTYAGSFFGSYDYDQYYLEDIQQTYDGLKAILAESLDEGDNFVYSSSW